MGYDQFISEVDGKFSIDRIFNDKKYNFGVFNTYEEALDKIDYLEDEGWPISVMEVEKDSVFDSSGSLLNNIEKSEDKYIVYKFIEGEKVIFDEFDTLDEAKCIRNNLIDNAWESTEPYTRSKYGKYIQKDTRNKFVVKRTYKGKIHILGYFKTLDEAIKCREELVSTNWGDLNIPLQMRPGKYVSYNGIMYTIQKILNGKPHVYGFFNNLDDALKQRDWLMDNNWSRLEVPDDSKRFIHKKGDKFLIYKNVGDDLEYYGTYDSLEEAKFERNRLIENNWVIPKDQFSIEKISDFVYYNGEFYTIENEIDNQKRIYGVYKNKNQAIADEKSFIHNDWDAPYAIPTEEYPYGEHIEPFDYIFFLVTFENGVRKELGSYYSFRDAIIAKEEFFSNEYDDRLIFSVKIGKSYKNRGWSIIRDTTYDLIPKLDYEDSCDIIVDGIPTTARLNLLPRIFYTKTDELVNHLENLAKTDPNGRIDVQLLLNKNNPFDNNVFDQDDLDKQFTQLTLENSELKSSNVELREILEYIDDENKRYIKKFNDLSEVVKELADIEISVDELTTVSNGALRIKIFDILDQIKLLNECWNDD